MVEGQAGLTEALNIVFGAIFNRRSRRICKGLGGGERGEPLPISPRQRRSR